MTIVLAMASSHERDQTRVRMPHRHFAIFRTRVKPLTDDRWMVEHGHGSLDEVAEVAVPRSRL